MELIISQSFNIIILLLCFGAFFIKNSQLLKIAGVLGVVMLFLFHSLESTPTTGFSNITLVLINAFYLFKVYTYQQNQS